MIKIDNINKSNEVSKKGSFRKVGEGTNFSDYLTENSLFEAKDVQSTMAMTSADAIFAAQMINDEEERQIRNKLVKKANKLLEKLEDIRDALLVGEISKDKLIELSRMVKQRDTMSKDEKLQEIMQEIELRVEVELAKLMY